MPTGGGGGGGGEAHRATFNDALATVHSSTKATSDCGECMGEGRLSQRALRMQPSLVLKPRRKQVFWGSDGGLVMQRNMDIREYA